MSFVCILASISMHLERKDLDLIEHFCGKAVLASEAAGSGYRVAAIDKPRGPGMDVLKPSGYGTRRLQIDKFSVRWVS